MSLQQKIETPFLCLAVSSFLISHGVYTRSMNNIINTLVLTTFGEYAVVISKINSMFPPDYFNSAFACL